MPHWRLAPAAVAAALAIAACGSGGGPIASAQTGSQPGSGTIAFARCMRAHGVPQFPDPGGPAPSGSSLSILGARLPATTDVNAPAFRSALNTCMKGFLAAHPRPPMSAAQKADFLRFSRCMRAHGVPNFPDPRFSPTGAVAVGPGPGTDVNSVALEHAQRVCGNP
jgi:hypothetical protein